MTDQEKTFFNAQKYFLALKDKVTKYKMAGMKPPDYLLENLFNAKTYLDKISKELE